MAAEASPKSESMSIAVAVGLGLGLLLGGVFLMYRVHLAINTEHECGPEMLPEECGLEIKALEEMARYQSLVAVALVIGALAMFLIVRSKLREQDPKV
jgi:hypothetical protein